MRPGSRLTTLLTRRNSLDTVVTRKYSSELRRPFSDTKMQIIEGSRVIKCRGSDKAVRDRRNHDASRSPSNAIAHHQKE